MEVIYLLIPISLALLALIVGLFLWSVRSGQFDDMEGPAHRILMDDDSPQATTKPTAGDKKDPQ